MLKIPTAADTPPPLMSALPRVEPQEQEQEQQPAPEGHGVVKRRRKSRKGGDGHSWEHQSRSSGSARAEGNQMRMMFIGGTVLFGLIVGGVFVSMSQGEKRVPESKTSAAAPAGEAPAETKPAAAVATRSEAVLLAEAEVLAGKFLAAKSVEEMLPLVRNPEVAEARMRSFYQEDGVIPPGLSKFNSDGGFSLKGKMISLRVVTNDFEQRSMAFVETPAGLRIDWESWCGWSEMPWEKFLDEKPTEAKVFRVIASAVVYYNFGFDDESKWKSYQLLSPDKEHSIYGYAEKDSITESRIILNSDTKTLHLTLALKFPPDATSANQVVIERFLNEGWVEDAEE